MLATFSDKNKYTGLSCLCVTHFEEKRNIEYAVCFDMSLQTFSFC